MKIFDQTTSYTAGSEEYKKASKTRGQYNCLLEALPHIYADGPTIIRTYHEQLKPTEEKPNPRWRIVVTSQPLSEITYLIERIKHRTADEREEAISKLLEVLEATNTKGIPSIC